VAEPYIAPIPSLLDLGAGYQLQVNAVDPDTGDQVTGVVVSNFSIIVSNLAGGSLEAGPFMLVPGPENTV
jgi:hypothetical protein